MYCLAKTMVEAQLPRSYKIGQVAAQTGVTPDAIRYYERLGLLALPARSAGGFRLYTAETVARLRFIAQAKTLDLSLEEIRQLVAFDARQGRRQCRRMRDVLAGKLAALELKLAELHALHQTLSESLSRCNATLAIDVTKECPVVEALDQQPSDGDRARRRPKPVIRPGK